MQGVNFEHILKIYALSIIMKEIEFLVVQRVSKLVYVVDVQTVKKPITETS